MSRHRYNKKSKWQTPGLAESDEFVYSTWSNNDWLVNGHMEGDPRINRSYVQEDKMGIPLPIEFIHKFPNLPLHKAQEKWEIYLNEIRKVFLKRLPFMHDETTTLSTKQLRDNCGRFYPYGKVGNTYTKEETRYVYNEFYPLYPFFAVTKTGSNITGKNSEVVVINQQLIDLLIDTADHEELVTLYYGDLTDERIDQLEWIDINSQSLNNYIKSTTEKLKKIDQVNEKEYYLKLLRSLRQAKYIKIITDFFGNDQFPLRKKVSPYGRTYYEGLNLHNCHKEVRNAALGDNYQYDLEAAVYAIKLMLIDDIYKEKGLSLDGHYIYTKEYLDQKSHIRNRLAEHIRAYPDGLKLVKEALTAMGFGARISGGAWLEGTTVQYPAINSIIMNQDDRERFINDPWVVEFYKEQKQLTKEIVKYYKEKSGWCEAHLTNLPRSTNRRGKFRDTAIMSYLFQQVETLIMDKITKNIDSDDILLRVHDCIITKDPLNGYDLSDMREQLQSISNFLRITSEYNRGWLDIDTMNYEIEHKQFIANEELRANKGIMPVKYTKPYSFTKLQNDSMCYDGYDDGTRYDRYDVERDDMLEDMTLEEREEHFRIVGHEPNKLPNHIQRLLHKPKI
jgi:hypothetical protein